MPTKKKPPDPLEIDPLEIDPLEIDPLEIDPLEIDPLEIETSFIQELVGENIVLIIHDKGITILMDEEIEHEPEQIKKLSHIYVAIQPSFVLHFFLSLEAYMLYAWEKLEDMYNENFKK
jgi:hypothetical protein